MHSFDPADDSEFPSGDWVGYFQQSGSKSRMDLRLTFATGRIRGTGGDKVCEFQIRGAYNVTTREVTFHKLYLGAHDVWYRGFRDTCARGIWGTWEIGEFDSGGFHIWPLADGEGISESAEETIEEPVLVGPAVAPSGSPADR